MKLSDLDHLRDDRRIRFNTEEVNGETVTICCYMVGEKELWQKPLSTECRGIVFNSKGDCISRPLPKFFNLFENEDTQLSHLEGKNLEILEKRDGSLLVPVLVGGKIAWKTKKSFYSEVAVEASKTIPENVVAFSRWILHAGFTPSFEYTSQFNKVVLDYGLEPKYMLLAIRNTATGKQVNYQSLSEISNRYRIDLISLRRMTVQDCLNQVETLENFEGWCVRDVASGFYCKIKTKFYLRQHKARTQLRERDCFDFWLDDSLDDIKSSLAMDGFDLTPIEAIEHKAVGYYTDTEAKLNMILDGLGDRSDFKSIALEFRGHPMFNLIMSSVRGKDVDIKDYVSKVHRDEFPLVCVYNHSF